MSEAERASDLLRQEVAVTETEGYIRKTGMKDFCVYFCAARNFSFGIWHGGRMHGVRHKWRDSYIDAERHWDDGADGNGTCRPLLQVTESLEERIHPSFFDPANWRGQSVLHDILFPFERLSGAMAAMVKAKAPEVAE